jgi:hypothetical protein
VVLSVRFDRRLDRRAGGGGEAVAARWRRQPRRGNTMRFCARGDFAKTPNPLIYLDSTVRQSTGFERSAFEQRHKIAISRAFSERTFAPARSVATPARSAAKIKKFGSKDSPLISRGFFRCRRGDFFAAEEGIFSLQKISAINAKSQLKLPNVGKFKPRQGPIFLVLRYGLRYHQRHGRICCFLCRPRPAARRRLARYPPEAIGHQVDLSDKTRGAVKSITSASNSAAAARVKRTEYPPSVRAKI